MFKSMKIPRKLALSFLVVCVSAAAMMAVFFMNITSIHNATDSNNLSQTIHAKALTLETSLLRQNSQMRGYLVTADASYLKSYDEARSDYDSASRELETMLTEAPLKAALLKSREATLDWRKTWGDRLIARVKAGQRDAAQADVRAAGKAVLTSAAVLPLREIRDAEEALIDKNSALQLGALGSAVTVLVIGGIAMIGIAVALAFLLSQLIAKPISWLTATMADLAAGNNHLTVPDLDRRDELGDMARAVLVFQQSAVAKANADAEKAAADVTLQMVVETLGTSLSQLSARDLTVRVTADYPGAYAVLKGNFNDALDNVRATVQQVSEGSANISTASQEIALATEDLARRTESNAASLEETSAALVEMETRLKATATAAQGTTLRADQAMATVDTGRATAEAAKQAMGRVSGSAKGIDDVIEGLDKIAFQTRVLAMNAAVEAGRAGDAGRGFAVVADLVSALAMRAEEEAKRARDQLSVTQSEIVTAVDAVGKVDLSLTEIASDVAEVNKLLAGMAADNVAQSSAITEITAAVSTMDRATQQNAAMVEQTSAAARNLTQEVGSLASAAAQFKFERRVRNVAVAFDRRAGGRAPTPTQAKPGSSAPVDRRSATTANAPTKTPRKLDVSSAANADWVNF